MRFESIKHLFEWLIENERLVITTKPQRLTKLHILAMSMASGDFNPAHCRPGFEKRSFFKGMISQGHGVLSRGEGHFVRLVPRLIDAKVEVIAIGYEEVKFLVPVRLGDIFHYKLEIFNMRFVQHPYDPQKNRWDMSCCITCEVRGSKKPAMKAIWMPSLVEHPYRNGDCPTLLKTKDYWQSILEIFVTKPLTKFAVATAMSAALVLYTYIGWSSSEILTKQIETTAFYACT